MKITHKISFYILLILPSISYNINGQNLESIKHYIHNIKQITERLYNEPQSLLMQVIIARNILKDQ